MAADAGLAANSVSAQVTERWQAVDPLLPAASVPLGCEAELIVADAAGQPVATGACEHWGPEPGSMEMTWGAARRFRLTPHAAGPDPAESLDRLLSAWHRHLAGLPGTGDEDTAAIVTWPSRDVGGVNVLLRHALVPLSVIAARRAGRPHGRPHGSADGAARVGPWPDQAVSIRQAGPADLDAVARLGLEVVRFDAQFGCVIERPYTADALRRAAAGLLAAPDPWIWLAEHDGQQAGLLYAERPAQAAWIAPMAGPAPVAYLELMFVLPGERARGVGTALVAHFHRVADAAGVAVTLLHYEQANPLSGPFWSQQGYRPLWTAWEARPAAALR